MLMHVHNMPEIEDIWRLYCEWRSWSKVKMMTHLLTKLYFIKGRSVRLPKRESTVTPSNV